MEAGLDARQLYERASALAPKGAHILVGLAAARAAMGEGDRAIADMQAALDQAPAWLYGHEQLAQLMATEGKASEATASLERALTRFPNAQPLVGNLAQRAAAAGRIRLASRHRRRATGAGVSTPEFQHLRGHPRRRVRRGGQARCPVRDPSPEMSTRPRQLADPALASVGATEAALPLIDRQLAGTPECGDLGLYGDAWRMAGDPRSEWLEQDPAFVDVIDLSDASPPIGNSPRPCVRCTSPRANISTSRCGGGTQTDGPLLSRIDPVIQHLRRAIVGAVENKPHSSRRSTRTIPCFGIRAIAGCALPVAGRSGFGRTGITRTTFIRSAGSARRFSIASGAAPRRSRRCRLVHAWRA